MICNIFRTKTLKERLKKIKIDTLKQRNIYFETDIIKPLILQLEEGAKNLKREIKFEITSHEKEIYGVLLESWLKIENLRFDYLYVPNNSDKTIVYLIELP